MERNGRVDKGALAPCPPLLARRGGWARSRFAHPTVSFNAMQRRAVAVACGLHYRDCSCGECRGSAVDEKHVAAFNALPQPSSCRLIDFDDVQVIPGTV